MRYVFLLLALAWPVMFVAPAAGQEASDLTFEGAVAETSDGEAPTDELIVGSGFIRITLTPAMDGVLRAEILGVLIRPSIGPELQNSKVMYYWPPRPIEGGSFAVGLPIVDFGMLQKGVMIEGEVVSSSELRGTLVHSIFRLPTTWSATGPADTPPGAHDRLFAATVEGGGRLTVAFADDGLSVTSFDLKELQLDPCLPGETLSVRAFGPGTVLGEVRVAGATGEDFIQHYVELDVTEADSSRASGTLHVASIQSKELVCDLVVSWQSEPVRTAEPTATPLLTPAEEPTGLPAAGGGGARGVPSAWLAILAAGLGAALAAVGLFRMRA